MPKEHLSSGCRKNRETWALPVFGICSWARVCSVNILSLSWHGRSRRARQRDRCARTVRNKPTYWLPRSATLQRRGMRNCRSPQWKQGLSMAIEVRVPEVGESITEVEIGEWLKAEGDTVKEDEDLVVIESEKATVEVAAPQSGRLSKVLKNSGETAHVGEVIALLELPADAPSAGARKQPSARAPSAPAEAPKPAREKTRKP